MKSLITISGKEIKVSKNISKRTYTLRVNGSKYRTNSMSSEEYYQAELWTGNDWNEFLKTDEYYLVK